MIYYCRFDTNIGEMCIASKGGKVIKLYLSNIDNIEDELSKIDEITYSKLENDSFVRQIRDYACGNLRKFNIDIILNGTEFQKKVWKALIEIPYGETATYKEIAYKIGCDRGYRAVGNANNKNSIPIIIPCHRVIGSNNNLVGFAGGLDMKIKLLEIEGIYIKKK
ncbi:methylated-DNA--[protein]-cysteine S-methyltransferase [Alkalithermobacter paradoxus]|uniref:Methylated-DNA--protein-cysteine methyltransferase n=1 Tax=Alkalithermobacter paradoxus TaxID=29349 RepID=A0A1V4I737_9FIRM|nr:methylated-DNA--protein-cysteine methyltransferase, constitutive [[Clostridium] thermoalcaliphilum]